MKKKNKILAGVLAGLCAVGGGFALAGCNSKTEKPDSGIETPVEETLTLLNNFKTTYYVGEQLDVSNGVLKYTNNGNPSYVEITADMIEFFNTNTAGERTMVITYQGKTLEVDYIVLEPIEMTNKAVYYCSPLSQYSPFYQLIYIDRTVGKLYTDMVSSEEVGCGQAAAEKFDLTSAQSIDFTEEIVAGKRLIKFSVDMQEDVITTIITPNVEGKSVSMSQYTSDGTMVGLDGTVNGKTSVEFYIYDEDAKAAFEAMPKMADKEVYCCEPISEQSPFYQLIYIDRTVGKIYLSMISNTEVENGEQAAEKFDMQSAQSMEFIEKIENGKRIIEVVNQVEGDTITMTIAPNDATGNTLIMTNTLSDGTQIGLDGTTEGPKSAIFTKSEQ